MRAAVWTRVAINRLQLGRARWSSSNVGSLIVALCSVRRSGTGSHLLGVSGPENDKARGEGDRPARCEVREDA